MKLLSFGFRWRQCLTAMTILLVSSQMGSNCLSAVLRKFITLCKDINRPLLPTGSDEKRVFGVGSIPVAIHPSWHSEAIMHYERI